MKDFYHVGLFEGIGGFSLACSWNNIKTIAYSEIDKFCINHLKYYFPEADSLGDITKAKFEKYANKVFILTGGFPCQPFSLAGKRKGTEDPRSLWGEMFRAIREIKPRWIIAENVSGFINWEKGLAFDKVQLNLASEGYTVWNFILPAAGVSAPHKRDRIWIIAFNASNANSNGFNRSNFENEIKPDKRRKPSFNESFEGNSFQIDSNANSQRSRKSRNENTKTGNWNRFKSLKQLYRIKYPKPDWKNFPTEPAICGRNDGIPQKLDIKTFTKWKRQSLKAYGNAIVPQIPDLIIQSIFQFEKEILIDKK